MNDGLVLDGDFAGVWSAAGEARSVSNDELRLRLISTGNEMVIRPRLFERNPDKMRVSLDSLLGPIGVNHVIVQWIYPPADSAEAPLAKGGHLSNGA